MVRLLRNFPGLGCGVTGCRWQHGEAPAHGGVTVLHVSGCDGVGA